MQDLCEIAGVSPVPLRGQAKESPDRKLPQSALLLTETGSNFSTELPVGWIRVLCEPAIRDASADLEAPDMVLPEDAEDLMRLVRDWADDETTSGSSILLGSWHGGSGVTTSAFALAETLGGVVLDASATPSFPFLNGLELLFWEDIDALDMPPGAAAIAALPRVSGVPTLTSASPGPLRPRPEQVVAVATASPRVSVIDCGGDVRGMARLWDELAQAGQEVRPVLLGRATDRYVEPAVRAFTALDADSLNARLSVLTVGRVSSLFSVAEQRFHLQRRRAPNPKSLRGWRRIAEGI